ncbi:SUMF1/EgtB/PvdO family nonheme iron enzyme [Acaryochloris marina NIES-2412]|uniref:SUMF1/EgtB/PvdO family nonheme iron enzyme n=1 Tax=Acaryochloris marina TaxID=155978 RepID=UPI004058C073
MVCCLNPKCEKPLNPDTSKFCQQCGTKLTLLRRRFKMVRLLGKGMFGHTYLAEDRDNLQEPCIVKQLICQAQGTDASQTVVEPFLQEAEQLRRLKKNQHIPSILAYFEENYIPYLVQEYIDGQDLQQVIENQGAFSENQVRALLLELLPVLQTIHDQGVIHRDLKPAHIMRQHSDSKLILVGFCVSKQLSLSQLQQTDSLRENTSYAPPEVFAVDKARPGSDLYSLGATCVHLLTGVAPHALPIQGGEVWVEHWQQHLPQPLSAELKPVLEKLLRTDLAERYTSALEVLREVRGFAKATSRPLPKIPAVRAAQPSGQTAPQAVRSQPKAPAEPTKLQPKPKSSIPSFQAEVAQVDAKGQVVSRQFHPIGHITEDLGKDVTLELAQIPAGRFSMGSPPSEQHRQQTESPQHIVSIPEFYLSRYPITQVQWRLVAALPAVKRELDDSPSHFTGDDRPVESVSWFDVVEFCNRLSLLTGKDYHLPSESAWEYSCRAASNTPFAFGETLNTELANYDGTAAYGAGPTGNFRQQTTRVGKFPANPYGLSDMHGNVWEWCADHWHGNYGNAPVDGSVWQDQYFFACVLRGGAWNTQAASCRSASRIWEAASEQSNHIGFRVACTLVKPASP